ncbi:polyprotein [Phanerochaete sordida]|uniref:RNA-directed DNA polymerase n=1 Tax=Phanerochaete sordida TaxID=48140 RepID=A0A9P3LJS3_9APHY|nr:polyprotein [Phanerochaete sordida]
MPTRRGTEYLRNQQAAPKVTEDAPAGAPTDTENFQAGEGTSLTPLMSELTIAEGSVPSASALGSSASAADPAAESNDVVPRYNPMDGGMPQRMPLPTEPGPEKAPSHANMPDDVQAPSGIVAFDDEHALPRDGPHPGTFDQTVEGADQYSGVSLSYQDEDDGYIPAQRTTPPRSHSPQGTPLDTNTRYFSAADFAAAAPNRHSNSPGADRQSSPWSDMVDDRTGEYDEGRFEYEHSSMYDAAGRVRSPSPSLNIPLPLNALYDDVIALLGPDALRVLRHKARRLPPVEEPSASSRGFAARVETSSTPRPRRIAEPAPHPKAEPQTPRVPPRTPKVEFIDPQTPRAPTHAADHRTPVPPRPDPRASYAPPAEDAPRIPGHLKGKGRAHDVPPHIPTFEPAQQREDTRVAAQVEHDARLARLLQEQLNAEVHRQTPPPAYHTAHAAAACDQGVPADIGKPHDDYAEALRLQRTFDDQLRAEKERSFASAPTAAPHHRAARSAPAPATPRPARPSSRPPHTRHAQQPSLQPTSQLPEGTFLQRTLRRSHSPSDPSSSDDSDDDHSSRRSAARLPPSTDTDFSDRSSVSSEPSEPASDASERTRKKQKAAHRRWRKKVAERKMEQSGAKPDPPFVYNGEPKYETYEKWVVEVKDWLRLSYIRRKHRVARLKKYLSGPAFQFYMQSVAAQPYKWRLKDFLADLFDHCFPSDFRSQQRTRFEAWTQRGGSVRTYRRELERLAASIGDVSDRAFVLRFWAGADPALQRHWLLKGLSGECDTISTLVDEAERYERATKVYTRQARLDRRRADSPMGRHVAPFRHDLPRRRSRDSRGQRSQNVSRRDRDHGRRRDRSRTGRDGRRDRSRSRNRGRRDHNGGDRDRHRGNDRAGPSRNTGAPRTQAERDAYRAQGKCFDCGETTHLAKDCPKKKTMPRPTAALRAVTVDFDHVDQLSALKAADSLDLMAVDFGFDDGASVATSCIDADGVYHADPMQEIEDAVRNGLLLGTPYTFDSPADDAAPDVYDPSRFSVTHDGGTSFVVSDAYADLSHSLHMSTIQGPDFDPSTWLETAYLEAIQADPSISGSYMSTPSLDVGSCPGRSLPVLQSDIGSPPPLFSYAHSPPDSPDPDWPRVYTALGRDPGSSTEGASSSGPPPLVPLEDSTGSSTSLSDVSDTSPSDSSGSSMPGLRSVSDSDIEEWSQSTDTDDGDGLFSGSRDAGGRSTPSSCRSAASTADDISDGSSASVASSDPVEDSLGLCAAAPRKRAKSPILNAASKLERTSARPKDFQRKLPRPVIVIVHVNDHPIRALLDSGSLADFISTTVVDQLKVRTEPLAKPLSVNLAVTGSRSKVNHSVTVQLRYQGINAPRRFDVLNLDSYDAILGTPFLFQHSVLLGLNPTRVAIGSDTAQPIAGDQAMTLSSVTMDTLETDLEALRTELREYALPMCKNAVDTPLPPLRAINHTIPLIDESKTYPWRPARCPEALKPIWRAKREAYSNTGRWEFQSGTNSVPLLILPKPDKGDGVLRARTTFDCRARNDNTRKLASPLPNIEDILRNVVGKRYRSLIDGNEAFEQIRVVPEHVPHTLFNTPEGTMVSHVLQQGDCNGPATYQAVMNHIFAPYIGVFMDVYLDDIVIYSDTAEEHVRHVKLVIDVLRREQFYLSAHKLNFFASALKILGHIIDDKGVRMDPDKVDRVANWKVPTNRELLSGFLGAVGFLAPDCEGIRIPMGDLTPLTGTTTPWRWGPTEQRAFDAVKDTVQRWSDHHRVRLDYSPDAPPILLITDASLTGASGVLAQGADLTTARVAAFWSGKFNSAQQNYPVHEQELFAIVESLKRFAAFLYGARFRILTDHKGLEFIKTQKNLSPRQVRWLETLSVFDFEVQYIPGETNILADALSRMYAADAPGAVRSRTEYADFADGVDVSAARAALAGLSRPVQTGPTVEASVSSWCPVLQNDAPVVSVHAVQTRSRARAAAAPPSPDPAPDASPADEPSPTVSPSDEAEVAHGPRDGVGLVQDSEGASTSAAARSPEATLEAFVSPPLTSLIALGNPGVDLPDCLRDRYADDSFFKVVLANPSHYPNFTIIDGLIFLRGDERNLLCIPDIFIGSRKVREIVISHAHSILAHLGHRKTLHYLKNNVWWKDMVADVRAYCDSCSLCATTKPSNQAPFGLLQPLPVPSGPWETVGIDFVGPLPESRTRHGAFDMITVIIDHFSAMVHLVPSLQTYRARDVAELVFDHIYKLHGLPRAIVSDRDSLFTSLFWDRLHKLIGVQLRMSSSFHPQSDGMTERANRTMEQMLRQCISPTQKDWATRLPAIEFAMNSARSETTGFSPFFLNSGRSPRPMLWDAKTEFPGVRVFAQRMKDAVLAAHDAIIHARVKQTVQANRKRRPAPFAEGDLVYLSTQNLKLPKQRARKLLPKYIGPYKILKDYANSTYKLDLPSELRQRGLHANFHASLLRIHRPNDDRRFPGRLHTQVTGLGEDDEWLVERIVGHAGQAASARFKVQWQAGDVSWAPHSDVAHLSALQDYFEALGITKLSELPLGTAVPPEDPEIFVGAIGQIFASARPYMVAVRLALPSHVYHPDAPALAMADAPATSSVAAFRHFYEYAFTLLTNPAAAGTVPPGYDIWAFYQHHVTTDGSGGTPTWRPPFSPGYTGPRPTASTPTPTPTPSPAPALDPSPAPDSSATSTVTAPTAPLAPAPKTVASDAASFERQLALRQMRYGEDAIDMIFRNTNLSSRRRGGHPSGRGTFGKRGHHHRQYVDTWRPDTRTSDGNDDRRADHHRDDGPDRDYDRRRRHDDDRESDSDRSSKRRRHDDRSRSPRRDDRSHSTSRDHAGPTRDVAPTNTSAPTPPSAAAPTADAVAAFFGALPGFDGSMPDYAFLGMPDASTMPAGTSTSTAPTAAPRSDPAEDDDVDMGDAQPTAPGPSQVTSAAGTTAATTSSTAPGAAAPAPESAPPATPGSAHSTVAAGGTDDTPPTDPASLAGFELMNVQL